MCLVLSHKRLLEGYFRIIDWRRERINTKIKEYPRGMIEEFASVHKYEMATLFLVELTGNPGLRGPCNLACRNDENVIEEHLPVCIGVEDWMIDCHPSLSQYS